VLAVAAAAATKLNDHPALLQTNLQRLRRTRSKEPDAVPNKNFANAWTEVQGDDRKVKGAGFKAYHVTTPAKTLPGPFWRYHYHTYGKNPNRAQGQHSDMDFKILVEKWTALGKRAEQNPPLLPLPVPKIVDDAFTLDRGVVGNPQRINDGYLVSEMLYAATFIDDLSPSLQVLKYANPIITAVLQLIDAGYFLRSLPVANIAIVPVSETNQVKFFTGENLVESQDLLRGSNTGQLLSADSIAIKCPNIAPKTWLTKIAALSANAKDGLFYKRLNGWNVAMALLELGYGGLERVVRQKKVFKHFPTVLEQMSASNNYEDLFMKGAAALPPTVEAVVRSLLRGDPVGAVMLPSTPPAIPGVEELTLVTMFKSGEGLPGKAGPSIFLKYN